MNKKYMLMTGILLAGCVVSTVEFVNSKGADPLHDGNILVRNESPDGDINVVLDVTYEESTQEIPLEIAERIYSDEELDDLSERTFDLLERTMFENMVPGEGISSDITFPTSILQMPFRISYKVSDEEVLSNSGKLLCPDNCEKTHDVTVSAVLLYKDKRFEKEFSLRIVPKKLSAEEKRRFLLEEKIDESIKDSAQNSQICLPQEIDGKSVEYKTHAKPSYVFIMIGSVFACVLSGYCYDYDEKRKRKLAEENLRECYGRFTEKLRLFLMAGLNLKNAFISVCEDLEADNNKKYRDLCRYMKTSIIKLKNGVSEERVYEEFGKECGGPYRKLCYLLVVALKKGNDRLLSLLGEETQRAMAEKRVTAKKKGDEAGVKLMFPMMLMLFLVMIMILIPAYFGFAE